MLVNEKASVFWTEMVRVVTALSATCGDPNCLLRNGGRATTIQGSRRVSSI